MKHKLSEVQIISLGLVALYATTVLIYIPSLGLPDVQSSALVILSLYVVLFAGSVGLFLLQEWGRRVIVFTNVLAALYSLKVYFVFPEFIPMTYIFMNVVIPLFFGQSLVRNKFATGKNIVWKSVLIIDDDEGIVKLLRPVLMTSGYAVLTAGSGEEGLQVARVQKPNMILLDVILPGLKGRDVCKKLKEDPKTKNIPVVFLTSKDSPDDIKAEREVGAVAHLTKPVNSKELLAMISSIIG